MNTEQVIDISELNRLLATQDYAPIYQQGDLFWQLFCKVSIRKIPLYQPFSVDQIGLDLNSIRIVSPRDGRTRMELAAFVESLRTIIYYSLISSETSFKFMTKRHSADVSLYSDGKDSRKVATLWKEDYSKYLKPVLAQLFSEIGIDYSVGPVVYHPNKGQKKFQYMTGTLRKLPNCKEIQQETKRANTELGMYELYKNGVDCNYTIITSDNTAIKVNKSILIIHGGEMIRHRMEKSLVYDRLRLDYPTKSVKLFIDFLYLGEDGIKQCHILEKSVNLSELFVLASNLVHQDFIDHCLNLFEFIINNENRSEIELLAKIYNNQRLIHLCSH